MLWQDLQEIFWILYGPYITGLLLPVFIGSGLLLAVLMAVSPYWRPVEKVEVAKRENQES